MGSHVASFGAETRPAERLLLDLHGEPTGIDSGLPLG